MRFNEAFKAMKEGYKVKLPFWHGYWVYDPDGDRIMMHCRDGVVLEIRETDRLSYTIENILSDEWMFADETNTPELGGVAAFGFGEAFKYLKRGLKVARQGWNGKNQHIELASNISYTMGGEVVNCNHDAIGNKAIAFVGTSGIQMGWLASQADMLAEDWRIVD